MMEQEQSDGRLPQAAPGSRPSDGAEVFPSSPPLRASIPSADEITIAREMAIRDAALEEAARWVEESSLREYAGVLARRKRVREDAALSGKVAREERRDMARMIRARMANRYGAVDDMLRDIASGQYGHRRGLSTKDLAQAFLLAQRRLVIISVEATLAGSFNVSQAETVWRVRLSENGERVLAELDASATRSAETARDSGDAQTESHPA